MEEVKAQIVSFMILVTALIAEGLLVDRLIVPIVPRLIVFCVIGILQFLFLFPVIYTRIQAK